jgi:hypothetical protein
MVKYIQDLMTLPHGEIAASSAMTHWRSGIGAGIRPWPAPRCCAGVR